MSNKQHHSPDSTISKTASIIPAKIDWQTDDAGHTVPVSRQFGDVYFSKADGLAEAHHVFIGHNHLPQRFANLYVSSHEQQQKIFVIAELGFGTGLNFFATWLLWRQIRKPHLNQMSNDKAIFQLPRLHFISFEKHPLTHTDLTQALQDWQNSQPNLAPLISEFLANYPPLVAGCHRINFVNDALTLDLWLGDATDNLPMLHVGQPHHFNQQASGQIHAWYLDGFAPACNQSLWSDDIFAQIQRLSAPNATLATFSCAGVVKRSLASIGFDVTKVKGFGRKREMLTAKLATSGIQSADVQSHHASNTPPSITPPSSTPKSVLVIGAGIAGLMSAWALANRGITITLMDKTAPLSGASGNPRAVLAPRMTALTQVDKHLHSMSYLYGVRFYQQITTPSTAPIFEQTGVIDTLAKANPKQPKQIDDYPDDFAMMIHQQTVKKTGMVTDMANMAKCRHLSMIDLPFAYFPKAGLVNPKALAKHVLAHPLITYQTACVTSMTQTKTGIKVNVQNKQSLNTDAVVICTAYESCLLHQQIFDYRKIRGQVSWFTPTANQWQYLPKIPVKYGGYCTPFTDLPNDVLSQKSSKKAKQKPNTQTLFLLGASFVRNDTATDLRPQEHKDNLNKLINALADTGMAFTDSESISTSIDWQGRASIRAQTPDYHPVVGRIDDQVDDPVDEQVNKPVNANTDISRIWTMSGMGSKGFAFAPLCAELLADMMTNAIPPMPTQLMAKLSPNRVRLQTPLND